MGQENTREIGPDAIDSALREDDDSAGVDDDEGLYDFEDSTVERALDVSRLSDHQQGQEAYLIVLSGQRVGEMVRVGDRLTIGRGAGAGFRVNDPSVSKLHFEIIRRDGDAALRDLDSRNGTFVNGRAETYVVLQDGDKIQFGSTAIVKFSMADVLDQSFQQRMYQAAVRDPLTGLYNRRHLLEQLATELRYATRHRTPCTLALFDIDLFKRLNDTYGHGAGDKVLRGFAKLLVSMTRSEDLAVRYGGEEFVLVFRGTNTESGLAICERVRTLTAARPMASEVDALITVSAGVCSSPSVAASTDPAQLIHGADTALYEAKSQGRNRICVAAEGHVS